MKRLTLQSLVTILCSCLLLVATARAHDASKHKNTDKPKCEAIKNMNHSKMGMNDPVLQAMMLQCKGTEGHIVDKDTKGHDNMKEKVEDEDSHN